MKKQIFTTLICVSITLTACTTDKNIQTNTKEQEIIRIGVIAPLTGNAEAYGTEQIHALKYELENINKKLANQNKKVKLIFEDGKCTGKDALSAFQKLTDIDNVKIILGGACSAETLGIAPIATEKEIFTLSPVSSSPEIEGASPFIWTLSPSDILAGKKIAEQMKKYKKVAIITEQTDFSIALENVWEKEINNNKNTTIVAKEMFTTDTVDFRNALSKIKQAKPDAIFLNPNAGITAENLLKQLGETNDKWKDIQLVSHLVYLPDRIREAGKNVAEGMIIIDNKKISDEKSLQLIKNIEENYGTTKDLGQFYTLSTVDGLQIVTDMAVKFGDDTKAMQQAMKELTYNGYSSQIHFGEKSFSQNFDMATFVVENGKAIQQN